MRGLNWQTLQIPFSAGVNQRTDDRALLPPELAVATDVQFDEVGGLQTRKPFLELGSDIASGGTISNARRLYANGNELVLFTKDALYSWNDQLNRWVFRATHLAISTEEKTAFATTGDQYDCDRAELGGIVFYAWTDTDKVYGAAQDKNSGAVILAPTAVGGTGTRPRLVALATRVLLFWHEGTDAVPGDIVVLALDPTVTDPATWATQLTTPSRTQVLSSLFCGVYYDVTRILTTDTAIFVARRAVTTSYTIAKVAANTGVSASIKARTCDGPIAVSSDPTGATVQVIRANGPDIQGDRITVSSLADAATGQAIGTVDEMPVYQIAAAHRSIQDAGAYRCYVFWTYDESAGSSSWSSKYNYVDTGGTIGTQGPFVRALSLGSRAFNHDGHVYVWGVFAGESNFLGIAPPPFSAQLQNTYFLYRDDVSLHAKAVAQRGGGFSSRGRLPGIALTADSNTYSWCATERRIIQVGSSGLQKSFDKRAPHDVTFEFDSNNARRCTRLGETLYISGAEILQYDGVGLYEVGFHIYPWSFGAFEIASGNLADGTYTYKVTWRWENAKGELDRSTTATHGNVTISGGPNGTEIPVWAPLFTTRKTTEKPIAVEVWRTVVNPTEGAPFYLVTSKDPAATTNPNRYIANSTTTSSLAVFRDEFADATATTKETSPENGDVLENLAPPGASLIAATDTRIFLGGVAGDPDRVWYSKLRKAGEVASFHDVLTFDVPRHGGRMTGLAFQNGMCVVFREYATYMFPGDGFDNTGQGQNYGPPQIISNDVGCRDTDSIAIIPEGIAFQSSKGKYLLTLGWTMKPIGLAVSDYDSQLVLATHVVAAQHQIRWLHDSRMLVYDYLVGQWAEWTIAGGVHAALWQGTYHYLAPTGPLAEQIAFSEIGYGMDIETAWIKPADLQGAVAIRKLQALGQFITSHHVRVRVAYDYQENWVDDWYWPASPSISGAPLQLPIRPSRQKMQAIKLRLTVVGDATQATVATAAGATPLPLLTSFGVPEGNWTATLRAIGLGTRGNDLTLTVGVVAGTAATVEVRDRQTFNTTTGLWSASASNVGVKVVADLTHPVTILALEAAVNAYSDLLDVSSPHASPDSVIDMATMIGSSITASIGPTSGGAFALPENESLKLTGLGLEVGMTPGLHKRFPR